MSKVLRTYTIRNFKIDNTKFRKIVSELKVSSYMSGYSIISVTKSGGVHFSGKKTKMLAYCIEIPISRTYVVMLFYVYPKGTIIHLFEPFNNNNKINLDVLEERIIKVMNIIKEEV